MSGLKGAIDSLKHIGFTDEALHSFSGHTQFRKSFVNHEGAVGIALMIVESYSTSQTARRDSLKEDFMTLGFTASRADMLASSMSQLRIQSYTPLEFAKWYITSSLEPMEPANPQPFTAAYPVDSSFTSNVTINGDDMNLTLYKFSTEGWGDLENIDEEALEALKMELDIDEGDHFVHLFHGTTVEHLPCILDEGIVPYSQQNLDFNMEAPGYYTTRDLKQALDWAHDKSKGNSSDPHPFKFWPIVIVHTIESETLDKLKSIRYNLHEPFTSDDTTLSAPQLIQACRYKRDKLRKVVRKTINSVQMIEGPLCLSPQDHSMSFKLDGQQTCFLDPSLQDHLTKSISHIFIAWRPQ